MSYRVYHLSIQDGVYASILSPKTSIDHLVRSSDSCSRLQEDRPCLPLLRPRPPRERGGCDALLPDSEGPDMRGGALVTLAASGIAAVMASGGGNGKGQFGAGGADGGAHTGGGKEGTAGSAGVGVNAGADAGVAVLALALLSCRKRSAKFEGSPGMEVLFDVEATLSNTNGRIAEPVGMSRGSFKVEAKALR